MTTPRKGMPGLKGTDHIGFTVPNLDEAIDFFVNVIGCEPFYELGPFASDGDWMQTHLNVHPRAVMKKLRFLRCRNGANFEVFEYEAPDQNRQPPKNSDVGGHHIAFYVDDIDAAVAYLKANGVRVLGEPTVRTSGPERRADLGLLPGPLGHAVRAGELSRRQAIRAGDGREALASCDPGLRRAPRRGGTGVPIEIRMPSVAPSMTEGGIARWAKQVGEPVRLGEVLFEVETDKAVVEVTATQDGVLASIVVPAGAQGVQVDALIALLAAAGEDPRSLGASSATAPPPASAIAASAIEAHAMPLRRSRSGVHAPATGPGARAIASPLARRIAKQRDVDLTRIRGSGPNGRILKADVEAAALPRALLETTPAAAGPAFEDVPHSNMRRVIAERLSEAKRTIRIST